MIPDSEGNRINPAFFCGHLSLFIGMVSLRSAAWILKGERIWGTPGRHHCGRLWTANRFRLCGGFTSKGSTGSILSAETVMFPQWPGLLYWARSWLMIWLVGGWFALPKDLGFCNTNLQHWDSHKDTKVLRDT